MFLLLGGNKRLGRTPSSHEARESGEKGKQSDTDPSVKMEIMTKPRISRVEQKASSSDPLRLSTVCSITTTSDGQESWWWSASGGRLDQQRYQNP